jgi:hypothetical protein
MKPPAITKQIKQSAIAAGSKFLFANACARTIAAQANGIIDQTGEEPRGSGN